MEEKKNKTTNKTAIIIACICGGVFFLFILFMFVLPLLFVSKTMRDPRIKKIEDTLINKTIEELEKDPFEDDDETEKEEEQTEKESQDEITYINGAKISSVEIETLYNKVKHTTAYRTPDFTEKSLRKQEDKVLLTIVANVHYDEGQPVTGKMIKSLNSDDCMNIVGASDCSYVTTDGPLNDFYFNYLNMDIIFKEVKELFNKEATDIKLPDSKDAYVTCFGYMYAKPLNVMIIYNRCGGYALEYKEAIYSYEEKNNEVVILAAYAIEGTDFEYNEDNEDFEINSNNYKNLKHLKYTFKKNSEGKYYVYDIEPIK